jgi:hypothetical protein
MKRHRARRADRRTLIETAAAGAAAGAWMGGAGAPAEAAGQASVARPLTEPERLARIAMTCWPQRQLFTACGGPKPNAETLQLRLPVREARKNQALYVAQHRPERLGRVGALQVSSRFSTRMRAAALAERCGSASCFGRLFSFRTCRRRRREAEERA